MKKIILAGLLAVTPVAAQLTGEFGRKMYGGSSVGSVLSLIFFIGLTLLVWLWVIKLWRDLHKKK